TDEAPAASERRNRCGERVMRSSWRPGRFRENGDQQSLELVPHRPSRLHCRRRAQDHVAYLRYLDTFVKKDGEWLFGERNLSSQPNRKGARRRRGEYRRAMEGSPLRVLILGGGVAGLETLMGLRELAGNRVVLTLAAPEDEFVYRPVTI